jgi:hypothetical protein
MKQQILQDETIAGNNSKAPKDLKLKESLN